MEPNNYQIPQAVKREPKHRFIFVALVIFILLLLIIFVLYSIRKPTVQVETEAEKAMVIMERLRAESNISSSTEAENIKTMEKLGAESPTGTTGETAEEIMARLKRESKL